MYIYKFYLSTNTRCSIMAMRMIHRCTSTAIIMFLHSGMLSINKKTVFLTYVNGCGTKLKLNEDKTECIIFTTKNNFEDNHCLVVGKDKV